MPSGYGRSIWQGVRAGRRPGGRHRGGDQDGGVIVNETMQALRDVVLSFVKAAAGIAFILAVLAVVSCAIGLH